ncbi:hypothetical protein B0H13DRAFT_1893891 [Mycena leptocephala]|nr:hypothetical protein B0H13DRAFT_1893891 [Mycena leptocephala]
MQLMTDPGIKKTRAKELLREFGISSLEGKSETASAAAPRLVSDVHTNPSPLEAAPRVSAGFFNLYYNAHHDGIPFIRADESSNALILNHTTGTINVSRGWMERTFAQLSMEDPPGLVRLMRRMLVLDPEKRASAQELLDDLYLSC